MKVLIVGGGIGGLTTALMLHARGIECEVFEQSREIRELGVGINVLPHAIRELAGLGLLPQLDEVAVRTRELIYLNRLGQEVWRELRGMDAGLDAPQFSIHRGRLQAVIAAQVVARLGSERIHLGCRLTGVRQNAGGVIAGFCDREGKALPDQQADVLVGADGIHSAVRAQLFVGEGPPSWNGSMIWRGAADWPVFLDGRTMLVAGGLGGKAVVYPIAPGQQPGTRLTNWAVVVKVASASDPLPRREDWSRAGRLEDLVPRLSQFDLPQVDVAGLIAGTPEFWEYPMCDRDPLAHWSQGRVTLLGDAAHPMYPVGSNGASQAILDARALADALAAQPVEEALRAYESQRLPQTAAIVTGNRRGGPEGVIDAVEALAPQGFEDVEQVLPRTQRQAIVQGSVPGIAPAATNKNSL
jgi:2-polyprenyl-6-methoxyphenol hydroxylase-like FAD-dependent oxidoreductase